MTVKRLWTNSIAIDVGGVGYKPSGDFTVEGALLSEEDMQQLLALMKVAALCNNARLREPAKADEKWAVVGDPTEVALLVAARKWGLDLPAELATSPRRHELPFDSGRKRMSVIHDIGSTGFSPQASAPDAGESGTMVAYVKGAPREVLSLCSRILIDSKISELDDSRRQEAIVENDEMARSGLRVLAMAYREFPAETVLKPEEVERDLTFVGLMAMMDPPRPEVEEAVKNCRSAGVRVIMITGDYGLTAESVARRIGLLDGGSATIVNGADVDGKTDAALEKSLEDQRVLFARVAPEHKMRIAAALRDMGEVVAMTGDGVNDAPALKRADIGIAMGVSGTDVAKEAATIVLADDNFATIVGAVKEGRVVYDNMRKFLAYIFAHLTPEVVPFAAFVLFGIPLPLVVMQILAIDLGTE
ncbi:MAG: HAD-IC family P-type ATPase, partial [Actinomycetota bacterium]